LAERRAPAFHVSRRGAYKPFGWLNATTRLPLEDVFLDLGEEDFGFLSVTSSKAFENAYSEERPACVEIRGALPLGEFEHGIFGPFISSRISGSVKNQWRASCLLDFIDRHLYVALSDTGVNV
jgi:hypothetical protein